MSVIDVKYINPFLIGTKTVFKTMFNFDTTMEKPFIKNDKRTIGDVTGIMGFSGDKQGAITVSLSGQLALFLYGKLMGEELKEITQDVVDSVGELTNIISGQSRKEFENLNLSIKSAIPMVVVGKNVEVNFVTSFPIISLPFTITNFNGNGKFYVSFSFED